MPPRSWSATGGVLKVGKRVLDAQRVYHIQSLPPRRDPSLGLRWAFRYEVTLLGSHGLPPALQTIGLPHDENPREWKRAGSPPDRH